MAGRWAGGQQCGEMKAQPGEQPPGVPKASLLVLGAAQLSDRAVRKLNEGIRKIESWMLAEKGT